ncbi:MAG: PASTA domain-containing protein [Thermodesulfobacteriota bacterium]
MKKSSRKVIKKTGPKVPAVMFILGILTILALSAGWGFSNEKVEVRGIAAPLGDNIGHGNILDRGYQELAVSFMMESLYARPLEVVDIDQTADRLAQDLDLDAKKLARELKSERSFAWLGRRLPKERADAILKKGGKGIYAVKEAQRFYPAHRSTAHVIGFLEENNGLAGIEFYYDHILRRGSDDIAAKSDNADSHLQLTLDLRIQEMLAGELGELIRKTEALSGSGIMMNINTGAIQAMVSLPDFDPNTYWQSSSIGRRNRAVSGGVDVSGFQRLFDLAMVYDDVIAGEQGELAALRMDLRRKNLLKRNHGTNWFVRYGDNLLSPGLQVGPEDSGNGIGRQSLADSLGLFGNTGIDLPEKDGRFLGQEGQASPLKLLTAFAVLVNGGTGITPHLGETIIGQRSGNRVTIDHPQRLGLIKPLTSKKMVGVLADVSRPGSEFVFLESMRPLDKAREGVAGEAPLSDVQSDRYQTVMIGFAPRPESEFALMIVLDRAVVASDEKTPMRSIGEDVFGLMMSLAAEEIKQPSPEVMVASENQIYTDWLASQVVEKKDLVAGSSLIGQGVMPDLVGMSMRKALRNLQQFGLKIEIVGSGRVSAQKPEAGMKIGGDECQLTLLAEI